MKILGRKDKDNLAVSPEIVRGDPGKLKEFVIREFRTVKNGLDPDQVIHFMESVLGSTETALKRMEHLAALQKSTHDIEIMITEARLLSERIKAQSEKDGQAEKERIIAEGRRQAAEEVEKDERQSQELFEQTRKTCAASIEGTRTYVTQATQKMEQMLERTEKGCGETISNAFALLQDVIVKSREMEQQAFLKTREKAEAELSALKKDIGGTAQETRNGLSNLVDQFAELRTEEPAPRVACPPVVAPRATPVAAEAGRPPVSFSSVEATSALVVEKAKASARVEFMPGPKKKNLSLCSGGVILFIPKEAEPAWIEELRQRLREVPGLSINMELGNLTGGKTLILSSSEPVDLASLLLDIPGVADVEEESGPDEHELVKEQGHNPLIPPRSHTLTVLLGDRKDKPVAASAN